MLLHKSVQFDSRVRREASALADAGHDVCVAELAEVPDAEAVLDGFRRRSCLPLRSLRRRLPLRVDRIAALVALVRGALATSPEVVHAHDAAMLLPGLVVARCKRARLVYDSHELAASVPYRERLWGWVVSALEWAVVPRCDAVITVSDGIADRLAERYRLRRRPTVVRNVSALAEGGRGGLRRRLGIDRDVQLVLHQGAPAPDRGCEVLLDAVARCDGVRLAFLGDPEPGYGERLRAEIERRGLGVRVDLLASVPLGDLLANTVEADVGVTLLQDTCENHRLALPNKLFEYIAARIPVIASAMPEIERLVGSYGIGWCVEPDDPDQLARAIGAAMAARGDAALGDRLERAAAELNWSRERLRLVGLYEEFAGGRSRSPRQARPPA
jgi:glycogen synthase